MYVRKLTPGARVKHITQGHIGTVIGHNGNLVIWDHETHLGASAVKEVHHNNLFIHRDD